jgi:hypothetical protein
MLVGGCRWWLRTYAQTIHGSSVLSRMRKRRVGVWWKLHLYEQRRYEFFTSSVRRSKGSKCSSMDSAAAFGETALGLRPLKSFGTPAAPRRKSWAPPLGLPLLLAAGALESGDVSGASSEGRGRLGFLCIALVPGGGYSQCSVLPVALHRSQGWPSWLLRHRCFAVRQAMHATGLRILSGTRRDIHQMLPAVHGLLHLFGLFALALGRIGAPLRPRIRLRSRRASSPSPLQHIHVKVNLLIVDCSIAPKSVPNLP